MVDFATVLNKFLVAEQLAQAEFAHKINVKPAQVSEWLSGKCKPGYDIMKAIFVAFPNVARDYWYGLTDEY